MSKRKKKQKMERQQYVVLYGENFWSFGIVIYKFVNWVLGVCSNLFVVHRRVREYLLQRRRNWKQKTLCFIVLHRIWENF